MSSSRCVIKIIPCERYWNMSLSDVCVRSCAKQERNKKKLHQMRAKRSIPPYHQSIHHMNSWWHTLPTKIKSHKWFSSIMHQVKIANVNMSCVNIIDRNFATTWQSVVVCVDKSCCWLSAIERKQPNKWCLNASRRASFFWF